MAINYSMTSYSIVYDYRCLHAVSVYTLLDGCVFVFVRCQKVQQSFAGLFENKSESSNKADKKDLCVVSGI